MKKDLKNALNEQLRKLYKIAKLIAEGKRERERERERERMFLPKL